MSAMYDPKDRGFPESFSLIDRAQVAMLRELASADARLVVKGGMAMRIVVGSLRLTKDIAFDCAADISTASVRASVRKALVYGAQSARLLGHQIDELKVTETTVRMRLSGSLAGTPVKFVVEVSGRRKLPDDCHARITVTPPSRYGIAPFTISAYTHDMLAASKIAAVMSPNRNVPRDVYDLNDLLSAQPRHLLQQHFDHQALVDWKRACLSKITAITFDQANTELLPYIPPDLRESLNERSWEEMTLNVAEQVERWLA